MLIPSPVPFPTGFVVKKVSKIFDWISFFIPTPLSLINNLTVVSFVSQRISMIPSSPVSVIASLALEKYS
jgi:hypothetical protein